MSKEHRHLPAQRGTANCRASDTEINLSYEVMSELKRGMSLHSYSYQEAGDWKCVIRLVYTTLDGKKHEITNTEIAL
jgi:hypothetical protein